MTMNTSLTPLTHQDGFDYDTELNLFYYDGDIDDIRKPWIQEPHFVPTIVVYGITFLFGIIGNTLVVAAIAVEVNSRTNTTMFLVSLAVSDLLFLIICVPYETASYFIANWTASDFLCRFSGFVEMLSAISSVLNLTVVSIERYIVIVHPVRSRYLCTLGKTKRLLPIVWLAAAALSTPSLFVIGTEQVTYYNNQTSAVVVFCADNAGYEFDPLIYSIYQLGIMFVVPTLIMLFCYARVIYVLWLSTQRLASMTAPERYRSRKIETPPKPKWFSCCGKAICCVKPVVNLQKTLQIYDVPCMSGKRRSRNCNTTCSIRKEIGKAITKHKSEVFESRKQVIKMLIAIILAFLICWGPKLILRVLMKLHLAALYQKSVFHVKIALSCLPYIQSCLNPVIYSFMSGKFRKSLRIVFKRKLHRWKDSTKFPKMELELSARTASSDMTKIHVQQIQETDTHALNTNTTLSI